MPLNKVIYTSDTTYSEVVTAFNSVAFPMDGVVGFSASCIIDETGPSTKTFDSGKLAVLTNQGITYTAVTRGTAGNSITVNFVNPSPAASQALSVPAVSGTAIVVNLATGAGVKASKVVQDLTFTADAAGVAGNSITMQYTLPSTPSQPLSLGIAGTTLSVSLATDAGVKATRTIQDLTFTAVAIGTGGNSITMTFVNPGTNNQPLSVALVGSAITVNLATDGAAASTSTATLIKAALDANGSIAALITTTISGVGSNVQTAQTVLSLTGGAAPASTSTATQIKAALDASSPIAALIDTAISGTGSNVQIATTVQTFSGGVDPLITSTTAQIVTALGLVASVIALITITGGDGTTATALTATPLATGADPEVNIANDTVAIPSHGYTTGEEISGLTTTGTLPAGLSLATPYWVIVADANDISFATSYANAIAGTKVNITDQGSNGAVNTVTMGAISGATVKVQRTNVTSAADLAIDANWDTDSVTETISADGVISFERNPVNFQYMRLVFTITNGRFNTRNIVVARGPN